MPVAIEESIFVPKVPYCRPGTGNRGPALLLREGSGSLPFVSVILPTRCEEKYIENCLLSILSQNYPVYRMEILVVDGMSTDQTRAVVRRIAQDFPQVRLLDNPERHPAQGLNRGIQASRGAYILRLDPRTEYGRGYVKACVDTLLMTGADNVGGPQQAKSRTFFQRMVACALQSPLSPIAVRNKNQKDGYVDGVFPGAFRRQALQRVGLFDPGALHCEDAEINQRILSTGGKIFLSNAIESWFYPRESFFSLAAHSARHGHGLARTVLKHGHFPAVNAFLPFILLLATAITLGLAPFAPAALLPAAVLSALCALVLFVESARMSVREHWACLFVLPWVLATMHAAHAAGFAWGLLYYSHNPDWTRITPPLLQH
jgi:succinoglycan biosynthesis protein ExoA